MTLTSSVQNDVNCQKPDALLQRGHASTQRVPFAPSSLNPSDLHRRHPPPPSPRRGAVDMGTPSVKDYSIVFVSPMPGDKQGISIREVLQRRYNYLKTGKEPKTFPVANPFTPVLAGFPVHWDKTLDSIEVVIKVPYLPCDYFAPSLTWFSLNSGLDTNISTRSILSGC